MAKLPKKSKVIPKYILIRDSREKEGHGWFFEDVDCAGTTIKKIEQGDYCVEGIEHLMVIERKGSWDEFAQNVSKDRERFYREIERLKTIKHVFLIIEDDLANIDKGWHQLGANYILANLISLQIKHGIHVVLVGKHGEQYIKWLLKKFWQYYIEGRL